MIVVQDKVKILSVRALVCNMKRLFSVLFFEQLQQNNDFLRNNLKLCKNCELQVLYSQPYKFDPTSAEKASSYVFSFLFSSVQFLEKGCSLEFTHKTANITYLAWLFPRAGHQKTICKQQQQQQQQQHRKGKQVIQISKIYCPWKQENAQNVNVKKGFPTNKQSITSL